MGTEGPDADLGRAAGEPAVERILERLAGLHGAVLSIRDARGAPLAAFGGDGARAAGGVVRDVDVYGSVVGSVQCSAAGDGAAVVAEMAASVLGITATREYEAESLSKSLLELFEEVNLFYGITAHLHAVSGVEGICDTILDRACEIVRAARASILLEDPRTGILRVVASRGLSPEAAARIRVGPGEGVVGRVMESGQAVLVDDVADHGAAGEDGRYASRSFLSVPLKVYDPSGSNQAVAKQRPLGVLNMTDKREAAVFTSGDLKLLSALAGQAAVLLENTRLSGIEKEMGIARRIQASLLPGDPPVVAGAELAGICVAARNVGGDYYDHFPLPGGRAGVLVADVSGHNVGAALMMAVSRASLHAVLRQDPSPREVMERVNALLYEDLARAEMFVSMFYAVLDPAARTLTFANAGHNLPFLLRAGADAPETLDADGILLGVVDAFPFEERVVSFGAGDLAVLYTDGFTEAQQGDGEMFGEDRLAKVLLSVRNRPAAEVARALLDAVNAFSAGADADDRTAVVLRATAGPGPADAARRP